MRKIVVEIAYSEMARRLMGGLFQAVESFELVELLKLDFERGVKMGVVELHLREGFKIDDVKLPAPLEAFHVIASEGDRCTVLTKVQVMSEYLKLFRQFDLDLVWSAPMRGTAEGAVLSCVGEDRDLRRFLELIRDLGTVKKVSFLPPVFEQRDVLATLTRRQREVLAEAKRCGYYSYPRGISAVELARRVGVSKATLLEHIRKAEVRVMDTVLAGL